MSTWRVAGRAFLDALTFVRRASERRADCCTLSLPLELADFSACWS